MRSIVRNLFYVAIAALIAIGMSTYGDNSGEAIRFVASQAGVSLQGTFNEFAANVKFDPAQPDTGSVQARVDVRSVDTGTASANGLLRSKDFFDAAKFPQATFEASEFHMQDAGHYVAKGTFTLKGNSVSLPVTFTTTTDPQGRWFDGSFTISRLSFSVGQGEWADTSTLDNAVRIQFHILQKKAAL